MRLEPEVKRENIKMAVGSAVCSLIVIAVFFIIGRFDYTVAIGAAVGFVYAVGNFYFMSVGITKALALGDETAAKSKMRSSYMTRTVVMLAIVAASLLLDWINPIPVLISVFYPKIIITACELWNTYVLKKGKTDEAIPEAIPYDDDEEEKPDEFEKFVGGFAKGPVPGEEDKNKEENKAE